MAKNLASEYIKSNSVGFIPLYYLQIRENKKKEAVLTLEDFLKVKPNNSFAIAKLFSLYSLVWDEVKIHNFVKKLKQNKSDIDYYPLDYEVAKFLSSKSKYMEAIKILLPYSERFSISNNKSRQDITLFDNKSKKPYFRFSEVKNSAYAKNYFQVDLAANYQILLSENFKKVSNFKKYQEHLNNYLYFGKGSLLPLYLIKKRSQKENAPHFNQDQFSLFLDENYHFSDFYDLANFYFRNGQSNQLIRTYKLMKKKLSSTIYNYNYLYQISKKNNIKIAFMQYPGFNIDLLKQFINQDDVILISNEYIFGQPPKAEYIYEATYPYSTPYKYYHYTIEGAKVLAKNLAQQLELNILNFP